MVARVPIDIISPKARPNSKFNRRGDQLLLEDDDDLVIRQINIRSMERCIGFHDGCEFVFYHREVESDEFFSSPVSHVSSNESIETKVLVRLTQAGTHLLAEFRQRLCRTPQRQRCLAAAGIMLLSVNGSSFRIISGVTAVRRPGRHHCSHYPCEPQRPAQVAAVPGVEGGKRAAAGRASQSSVRGKSCSVDDLSESSL